MRRIKSTNTATVATNNSFLIRKAFQERVYQNRMRDNFLVTPDLITPNVVTTTNVNDRQYCTTTSAINHETHSTDKFTYCYLCSINAHNHEKTKPVPMNKRRYLIPYDNPVEPKEMIRSINHEITARYLFRITTGSGKCSGTSSPVFVSIRGSEGYWSNFELKRTNTVKRIKFEASSVINLRLVGPFIGDLYKMKILHNAESAKDGWYLEHVEVINEDTKKKWLFDCHRWLSSYRPPDFSKETVLTAKELKLDVNESSCIERALYYVTVLIAPLKRKIDFDFNIYLEIIGDSNKILAKKLRISNEDEANNEHLYHFNFVSDNVPNIKYIRVANDSRELDSDVVIDTIIVKCFNIEKYNKTGQKLTRAEREANDFKFIFEPENQKNNSEIYEILKQIFSNKRSKSAMPGFAVVGSDNANSSHNKPTYSATKRSTSAESFRHPITVSSHNSMTLNQDDSKENIASLKRQKILKQESTESLTQGSATRMQSILKTQAKVRTPMRSVKFDQTNNRYQYDGGDSDEYDEEDGGVGRVERINRNRPYKQNYELSSIVPFKIQV